MRNEYNHARLQPAPASRPVNFHLWPLAEVHPALLLSLSIQFAVHEDDVEVLVAHHFIHVCQAQCTEYATLGFLPMCPELETMKRSCTVKSDCICPMVYRPDVLHA